MSATPPSDPALWTDGNGTDPVSSKNPSTTTIKSTAPEAPATPKQEPIETVAAHSNSTQPLPTQSPKKLESNHTASPAERPVSRQILTGEGDRINANRRRHNNNSNNNNPHFRYPNRVASLPIESSGDASSSTPPKLYLAGPFQADSASYNAAAAAAALAIASAPQTAGDINNSTAAATVPTSSPPGQPRPPYYGYPSAAGYPNTSPDQSAFFANVANNVPWAYMGPVSPSSGGYMARPPPGSIPMNSGRNSGKKNQRHSAGPGTTYLSPSSQSGTMLHSGHPGYGKSPPYYAYRNYSEGAAFSHGGGRASHESLSASASAHAQAGSPSFYPQVGYVKHGSGSRRDSSNMMSGSAVQRNLSAPAATAANQVGSEAGDSAGSAGCTTNLYVRGLAPNATDESLYELCKGYGRIYSSKAILDLATQECKGFGFVMYETEEETKSAFEGLVAKGYQVSYARTDPRSPTRDTFVSRLKSLHDEQSTNIYISNLPVNMDENGLTDMLKPHVVISAKILRDPSTHKSRGVGFARFDTREEASAAIQELHGKLLPDCFQHLQARFADSVAQKKFKHSSQSQYGFMGASPMMIPQGPYMVAAPAADGDDAGMTNMSPTGMSDGSAPETPAAVYFEQYSQGGPVPYMYPGGGVYYPGAQQQPMYYGGPFYPVAIPNPGAEAVAYESQDATAQSHENEADQVANELESVKI
ncbi:hypothetical protein BJ741DRAFT_587237 [Chytriomyces cf. hyalinus JEL632]|nr:hypothetical protein BJ741DRAFT_587237 [Chytriomyces cf. hyalinus JEL632]